PRTLITLSASTSSDPGPADTLTYAWNVTDKGTIVATGIGPTFGFTPTVDGVYGVSLVATDDAGATSVDSASITVDNLPAAAKQSLDVDEEGVLAGNATANDPDGRP